MKKETTDVLEKLVRFVAQIMIYMLAVIASILIIGVLISDVNTSTLKHVNVYNNITGEMVWSFEGKCYITESSDNYSIKFYDESGDSKVVTFMGNNINIISYEL